MGWISILNFLDPCHGLLKHHKICSCYRYDKSYQWVPISYMHHFTNINYKLWKNWFLILYEGERWGNTCTKYRWLRTKIEMELKCFNADKTTIHSLSLLDTIGKTKTTLTILYKLHEHFDQYVAVNFHSLDIILYIISRIGHEVSLFCC